MTILINAYLEVKPSGSTSLRDSIAKGISRILEMNADLLKNYGVKNRHFLHIIITDGQDNNSKITTEQLAALMIVLREIVPSQMITNHFIGIDLQEKSKDAVELLALSILGGDTSEFHLANGNSINEIFNRIQAKCGIITSTSVQAVQVDDVGVVGLQQRQRGFISLSVKQFIVLFNLDISGSMDGSRWRQLCKCITQFTQKLTEIDLVSVILFNDSVRFLNPHKTKQIGYQRTTQQNQNQKIVKPNNQKAVVIQNNYKSKDEDCCDKYCSIF